MLDLETLKEDGSGCIGTLREVSYDSDNDTSMIDSDIEAVNMDQLMGNYVRSLPLQDGLPRSVDAMVISRDGTYYLIEYKNGKRGNVNKDAILNKLYATLLMLEDAYGFTVAYAREHVTFVVVYNRDRLRGRGGGSSDPKRRLNASRGYADIQRDITSRSKSPVDPVSKGIRNMGNSIEGVFVKEYVYCDKSEFESKTGLLSS